MTVHCAHPCPWLLEAGAVEIEGLGKPTPGRGAVALLPVLAVFFAIGGLLVERRPGIVAVHDMGHDDTLGLWYIVPELVDGRSLDRILEERWRLLPQEAAT